MAGNIFINGTNINQILAERVTSKLANIGIKRNNVDVTNDFEKASSGTPAGNIGIYINNQAMGPMFAAFGGVALWDGTLAQMPASANESGNSSANALAEILFDPNGTIRRRGNYPFRDEVIGRWDGEVANSSNSRMRVVPVSGSLSSNSAPTFSNLSSLQAFSLTVLSGTLSATVEVELEEIGNTASRRTKQISLFVSHNLGGEVEGPEP